MRKDNLDIGYVLFSKRITSLMTTLPNFAAFVGMCLGNHIKQETGQAWKHNNPSVLPFQEGVRIMSQWRGRKEIVIYTERDKNNMPRTSVLLYEESGL